MAAFFLDSATARAFTWSNAVLLWCSAFICLGISSAFFGKSSSAKISAPWEMFSLIRQRNPQSVRSASILFITLFRVSLSESRSNLLVSKLSLASTRFLFRRYFSITLGYDLSFLLMALKGFPMTNPRNSTLSLVR
uniref:Uncharacterized protein n=1 Tax=Phlegmariurus squarrosus TaxID=73615 RepID=H9M8B1_PHLSQ|nr:hypothetical protein HusqMp19 [Phlegmariurus squarrosus]AEV55818.1 hypothetical protein HusqMp19 [Phlegmariurus squarrosus]